MTRRRRSAGATVAAAVALVAGCAARPAWQVELLPALSAARARGQDLVVYFALPGRDASDRMQARLGDPLVLDALAAGDFAATIVDGIAQSRLYGEWIGGGEGMGVAVLDGDGQVYCARPGPQDPEELAALLTLCAGSREPLRATKAAATQAGAGPVELHRLGALYLRLGCRVKCEPLLLDAAMAGVAEARHQLARLYALDGNLTAARRWLATSPETPGAQVTEGYVRFKERRHADAAAAFVRVLDEAAAELGEDRQLALLYLGKSLHEDKRDDLAVPILERLSAEGTGTTYEAAARHTLGHIYDPQHGHTH